MAEDKQKDKQKDKQEKKSDVKDKREKHREELKGERFTSITRILSTDIPGHKNICYGLTRIKGVSYSFANAACEMLKIDRKRKISSLSEEEVKNISEFIKNPNVPSFLLNRRKDLETGLDRHNTSVDLEISTEGDIKRLKKIRSYRGLRHALGLPTRGQRTKAHFRKVGKAIGVIKTKQKPATSEKGKKK